MALVNPELFGRTGLLGPCTCGYAVEIIAGYNKSVVTDNPKDGLIYSVSCFNCGVTYAPAAHIADAIDNYLLNVRAEGVHNVSV